MPRGCCRPAPCYGYKKCPTPPWCRTDCCMPMCRLKMPPSLHFRVECPKPMCCPPRCPPRCKPPSSCCKSDCCPPSSCCPPSNNCCPPRAGLCRVKCPKANLDMPSYVSCRVRCPDKSNCLCKLEIPTAIDYRVLCPKPVCKMPCKPQSCCSSARSCSSRSTSCC